MGVGWGAGCWGGVGHNTVAWCHGTCEFLVVGGDQGAKSNMAKIRKDNCAARTNSQL